jgi:hypothetical protein
MRDLPSLGDAPGRNADARHRGTVVIQVFGVSPGARAPVFALAVVWAWAAGVVAVKHALDYTSVARALLVCAFGLIRSLAAAIALGVVVGPALSGLS